MQVILSSRPVQPADFNAICHLPQNEEELFFMSPKASYPLTEDQLTDAVDQRFDSTVVLVDGLVAAFANFYEKEAGRYCSIGNVVVGADFRYQGVGAFLIQTMERIAIERYQVKEVHIACFSTNVKGLLLYTKLAYLPYAVEKRETHRGEALALVKLRKYLSTDR